jgi:hypothetical protein
VEPIYVYLISAKRFFENEAHKSSLAHLNRAVQCKQEKASCWLSVKDGASCQLEPCLRFCQNAGRGAICVRATGLIDGTITIF